MDYIRQINAFMSWTQFHEISDSEFRVYMAILHCSNRLFWNGNIPNKSIENFSDKGKVQLTRIRKRLSELGLIEYENGKKGQTGTYKIKPLYKGEQICDTNSDINSVTNVLPNPDTNVDTYPVTNIDTNSVTIIKHKTENIKQKTKNISSPLTPQKQKSEERFDLFWKEYPKKKAKPEAKKAWDKLKVSDELFNRIMTAVAKQKQSRDWIKDNGQYIPYPATWLNRKQWEDETEIDTDLNTNIDTHSVTDTDTNNIFLKMLEERNNDQRGNNKAALDNKSGLPDVIL